MRTTHFLSEKLHLLTDGFLQGLEGDLLGQLGLETEQKLILEELRLVCVNVSFAVLKPNLIWETVGHDVHLQGDGVHKALPPGHTVFI